MTSGRQSAIVGLCESAFIAGIGPSLTWREWLERNRVTIERVAGEQPQDERLAEAAAGLAERRSAG